MMSKQLSELLDIKARYVEAGGDLGEAKPDLYKKGTHYRGVTD